MLLGILPIVQAHITRVIFVTTILMVSMFSHVKPLMGMPTADVDDCLYSDSGDYN